MAKHKLELDLADPHLVKIVFVCVHVDVQEDEGHCDSDGSSGRRSRERGGDHNHANGTTSRAENRSPSAANLVNVEVRGPREDGVLGESCRRA